MKEYREKQKAISCKTNSKTNSKANVRQADKDIEEEKDIEEDNKDILDESDDSPKPAPKPSKHKYGEYNNVLLTDDELEKLKDEYPDYQDRIERLSSYVASTGKSYKSHYATIRNWARKDKEQQPQTVVKSNNKFNNFNQRKYDAEFFENLEKRNRESYKPADPERVQALQERLKQKYGKGKNNG